MPWEVQVISEDIKEAPVEINFATRIVDVDKFITNAIESLNRACVAKSEDRVSNDRSKAKETIELLSLCGVEVKLVEVPDAV